MKKQRKKRELNYLILNNRKSNMMVLISMFPVNNFIQGPKKTFLKRFTKTLRWTSNVVQYTSNRTSQLVTFVD